MMRLSVATLSGLPGDIDRPRYDRAGIGTGVVHLGIGAFHRAHQAVFFEHALNAGDLRWGVTGASLRSPAVHEALAPQDGLYSVVTRDGAAERVQVVGAVRDVLVAPRDPAALVARLAARDTHIVTLTVTEKGYASSAADSAAGYLAAALAERRSTGVDPFTAISCDNLSDNGGRLKQAVLAAARQSDPALADWIEHQVAFPSSMVDRIVPATDEDDIARLAGRIGVEDRAMVKTEPFRQWVIEDRFSGPRPDLAAAGVQLTADVAPWEEAKLRLLNGSHSAIAYLGGLAGIDFVHEVIALPAARAFVAALMDETAATLTPPPGLDVPAYRAALLARFANPALQHRTRQIAMDGSQKLPQRLLAPIIARLDRGLAAPALTLAVAAWMAWTGGRNDLGAAHAVEDPLASVVADALGKATAPEDRVAALLSLSQIFPVRLAGDQSFRQALIDDLALLQEQGARAAFARFTGR
ncbi:mannitol dehydrogenase family protein [Sphingomonas sp.]|uniref:mannitol dehydrogenase family protein n=1 Tax=Sphingomonas sp. TaxID=28214 RepID=UPI003D6D9F00